MPSVFRRVVFLLLLELGVMSGAPLRPDEVAELMRRLRQPVAADVLRDEDDDPISR